MTGVLDVCRVRTRSWAYWTVPERHWHPGARCWVSQEGWSLWWETRTGYVIRGLCGCWSSTGRSGQADQLQTAWEEIMAKRIGGHGGIPRLPHAPVDGVVEQMPSWAEWMTDSEFDDGSERDGGWLSVWCRNSSWHAKLKDQTEGLELSLMASSWPQLLTLIESAFRDKNAPWKRSQTAQTGKKRA